MRKEIENWWKQGKNDLEKAKVLFKSKNFDGTSFFCQQAVEKTLKALILSKTKEKNIEGHSLVYLGKRAKLPKSFFSGLKKLSPQYFISRYPDVTEEVPYELYDEKLAKEFLDIAEEVIKWIEKQLQ
jgi:HEPN domain-containing protein